MTLYLLSSVGFSKFQIKCQRDREREGGRMGGEREEREHERERGERERE